MTDGCPKTGKRRFDSKQEAYSANRKIRVGSCYRCPWCDGYHISSRKHVPDKKMMNWKLT